MNGLGEKYYEMGIKFFEDMQYESAVEYFIEAYNLGAYQEEIIENLYSCFIIPNDMEFRKNYEENKKEIGNVEYEDLKIDFIPVSDTKYYLFDKEEKEFLGHFEIEEQKIEKEVEFQSLLIVDIWDIREIQPFIEKKRWNTVYMVFKEQKEKFFSFLKLPEFKKIYLENFVVFESEQMMQLFFKTYPQFYLPKQLLAIDDEYYAQVLKEIHIDRIENNADIERDVFLSICIPSYNRGSRALEAVKAICQSEYDSEIEVIVSNNASTHDVEGYEIIKNMSDSRVVYCENETNVGALENILKLLEVAKGRYAVLSSDEDIMITSNLSYYMNLIQQNRNCGVFTTGGEGGNFGPCVEREPDTYTRGRDAVIHAINSNYMTGVCYNMELLRGIDSVEEVRKNQDNAMVRSYPHCFMNVRSALRSDVLAIHYPPLWYAGEAADSDEDESIPKEYMLIDAREEQHVGAVKLCIQLGLRDEALGYLYIERTWKFLWLIYINTIHYQEYYQKNNLTWEKLSKDVKERCIKNMTILDGYLSDIQKQGIRETIEGLSIQTE